jgi:hypothetical protein
LTSLLPVLSHANNRPDPREALLEMLTTMRERRELGERAFEPQGDAGRPARPAITPSDGDITPPGERAELDPGMRPGPDDPRPPVVIDADAVDIRAGFDDVAEPWRPFSHLYER